MPFLWLFIGAFAFALIRAFKRDMPDRFGPFITVLGCLIYALFLATFVFFTIRGIRLALSQ